MKILFVCKHNRFRSKVAETIFNKLNKNKRIKAESAGIILDKLRPYIEKNVINLMKKKGYNIKGKPKKATKEFLKRFNLIIIVADNVDEKFFSNIDIKNPCVLPHLKRCGLFGFLDDPKLKTQKNTTHSKECGFQFMDIKRIKWKISDCSALDIKSIKNRINQIEKRVNSLIKKI